MKHRSVYETMVVGVTTILFTGVAMPMETRSLLTSCIRHNIFTAMDPVKHYIVFHPVA